MPPPKIFKRTILVTGATDGIGRQLALELSSKCEENFVIIHGRSKRKCEDTLEYMIHENKLKPLAANLDYVAADFSHLNEICRMAEEIKLRFPRLNVLIGCASIVVPRKMKSHDGIELTLQVNHLSHYILWNSLLSVLESNAPSRILTVGSMLNSFNTIDFEDVMCEKGVYDKFSQYSRTKLMNHLSTFYIHRLLFKHGKQFQVTANVVDADQKTDRRVSRTFNNHFNALSASESHLNSHANGVDTLVRLVESPDYSTVSGKYFDSNGREMRKSADVGDVRLQDRLWEKSKQLCNGVLVPAVNSSSNNSIHPILLNNNITNNNNCQ